MTSLLQSSEWHDLLAIIKGFRNGAVYGAKIRFPHALVMTFLFRDGSFRQKMDAILDATFQHSRNLAFFVTLYKSLMVLQRRLLHGGKEESQDAFVAGLIGGYVVFGKNNNVNNQVTNITYKRMLKIVLYLFSRILVGGVKMLTKKETFAPLGMTYARAMQDPQVFGVFAATVWGCVMWLFRQERDSLQPSLQASMQYLYNDSEKWDSLRNWIWHNK